MARHIWTIVCQHTIIDQESNAATYINAIEEFRVPQFPFPSVALTIGTLWRRESQVDQRLEVRVRVLSPSGTVLAEVAPPPNAFRDKSRFRVNAIVGGFALPEPGTYEITVEQKRRDKWQLEDSVPVEVSLMDERTRAEWARQFGISLAGAKK